MKFPLSIQYLQESKHVPSQAAVAILHYSFSADHFLSVTQKSWQGILQHPIQNQKERNIDFQSSKKAGNCSN